MDKDIFSRLGSEIESPSSSAGLTMAEVLELPEPLRGVVQWMVRQSTVPAADIAARIGGDENAVRDLLTSLVEKGSVVRSENESGVTYQVRLAKRKREMPANIWQALDDKTK